MRRAEPVWRCRWTSNLSQTHTHTCTPLDEPWDVLLFHSSSTRLTHLCLCWIVVTATKKGSEWDAPLVSQIKHHSSPCISLDFCFCPHMRSQKLTWFVTWGSTIKVFSDCLFGPVVQISAYFPLHNYSYYVIHFIS